MSALRFGRSEADTMHRVGDFGLGRYWSRCRADIELVDVFGETHFSAADKLCRRCFRSQS